MMRRYLAGLALAVLLIAGCGGGTHHPRSHPATAACPQAASGHGAPGICAPKRYGLTAPNKTAPIGPRFPDLSNNDPCVCGAQIRAQGRVGLIVKALQGVGFIDRWAVPMIDSARRAGLAVGVYDFDQDYTLSEARLFVARAHAAGIYPGTPNTFPMTIDVEAGNFWYPGLLAQIAYLRSLGYRVQIYTGAWYWSPHAGCRWPAGVSAWLSGYPFAPVPCGTTGYRSHQYTETPIDMSVYLGDLAGFRSFVNATPKPKPSPSQIARWKRALTASQHVYAHRSCGVLSHRIGWFGHRLRGRLGARHKRALHASRVAYSHRSCQVFAHRIAYYSRKLR